MAYLKKDAPPDVLETLERAEAQADECWRALWIVGNRTNVAVWALLVGGIGIVEREQAARGSNTPHFDATLGNLSRILATAVKWAIRHGLTYDWLPVEVRDFTVRYDRASVNGVSIESQVFHSTALA
jgi:hypothetical protein